MSALDRDRMGLTFWLSNWLALQLHVEWTDILVVAILSFNSDIYQITSIFPKISNYNINTDS